MPSDALLNWQNDRMQRLGEVEAHCVQVAGQAPLNQSFLDESLRGFVLHLSAHFQGFCRDLYTECAQFWIAGIPVGFQATAQSQFFAGLALDKGNPNSHNIRKDFERFGFKLKLQPQTPAGKLRLQQLSYLNSWRNKAGHQGTAPLPMGAPQVLTLQHIQAWKIDCDGLATSLDSTMRTEMLRITGTSPW